MADLINSLAKLADYKGLVLSAYPTEQVGVENGQVSFTSEAPSVTSQEIAADAVFLKDVKEVPGSNVVGDKVTYTATRVSSGGEDMQKIMDEIEKSGKQPLFSIHGFQGTPDVWMNLTELANEGTFQDSKYVLIPVVWPGANSFNYFQSRSDAEKAAEAFKNALLKINDIFPRKSLLAVSMGNWVLKYLADEKLTFDNVFMSAPDVEQNIFTTSEGANIVKMVENGPGGKVVVFFNRFDTVLILATRNLSPSWLPTIPSFNPFTFATRLLNGPPPRLGLNGPPASDISAKVESVNVEAVRNRSDLSGHNYVFDSGLVTIYDKYFLERN